MIYVVREGFSIYKDGLVYSGGLSVDLSDQELQQHKHKLENIPSSVLPSQNYSSGNVDLANFDSRLNALIEGAPGNLNSLGEVAIALNQQDNEINAIALAVSQIQGQSQPTLSLIASGVEIFIDNVNGSDASLYPTGSNPFKTFARALAFARENYYFSDASNNFLSLILLSDYTFQFNESTIFDGQKLTGSVSLQIKSSSDATPRTITAPHRQPIVFKNFSYELKLNFLTFSANSFAYIGSIPIVTVTSVSFGKLTVNSCEVFYDLVNGSTFNGISVFFNVDDVRFLAVSVIKNLIHVIRANTLYFGGQIDLGYFQIRQVSSAIFRTNSSLSEATLALVSGNPVFAFRDINDINFNGTLNLNSTSGVLNRRIIVATHTNTLRATTGLVLNNTHTASISFQSTSDGIFNLIHSEATTFNWSSGTGFSPVFVPKDGTKKLISLEYSAYGLGLSSNEAQILTSIFASADRPVVFDAFSYFFKENFFELKSKVRRLNLTSDLALTDGDTMRQHLINQSGADRNVALPSNPFDSQEFEVINNLISTHNLLFAGQTVTPGTRHAVQWDGVEWIEL